MSATTSSIVPSPKVVLITGGDGLVGKAVQNIVEKENDSSSSTSYVYVFVSSSDGDLRDRDATFALFDKIKPDIVIHLAAFVGGLFKNLRCPVDMYRNNSMINDNVLEASRIFKVGKVVSCLSTCIFPDKTSYPIDESMLHNGPPHPSNEGYAYAKRMLEVMSRAYRAQYGCNFTCVIPTNVYGPHDQFELNDAHVIPGLVHRCYLATHPIPPLQTLQAEGGATTEGSGSGGNTATTTTTATTTATFPSTSQTPQDFVVWGSGTPLRQFVHSHDLATLILWTMKHYDEPSPLILSPNEEDEVSIADVAQMVFKSTMKDIRDEEKPKLIFDSTKSDGQHKKTACNKKLRALLPDFKFKPIEEGIDEVCSWFAENYHNKSTRK